MLSSPYSSYSVRKASSALRLGLGFVSVSLCRVLTPFARQERGNVTWCVGITYRSTPRSGLTPKMNDLRKGSI
jgi:hypothetical protein